MKQKQPRTFGQHLAELRQSQNLSVYRLAQLSGVQQMSISRYESGERNPSFQAVQKLARVLGVSVAEFENDA
jgi:transcriptional regulator with XRE-family HTH domain